MGLANGTFGHGRSSQNLRSIPHLGLLNGIPPDQSIPHGLIPVL
jgi:hypothetical protein